MTRITPAALFAALGLCAAVWAAASSLPFATSEPQIAAATAIFRGTVVQAQSYLDAADDHIYTRTVWRVAEVFKGKVPGLVTLVHRGGSVDGRGETDSLTPRFRAGEERVVLAARRADGTLCAARGEAGAPKSETPAGQALLEVLRGRTANGPLAGGDVTDQAAAPTALASEVVPSSATLAVAPRCTATNLMTDNSGIPARFILPDRGEPIPYWVDADYLPAGLSQAQALGAVQTALAAWTNVTSLRYVFAGLRSFGQAAANVNGPGGTVCIQLHDHYNYLASGGGDTLGIGGHGWVYANLTPGWTTGGNVRGNDFHKATGGYVVLQHASAFMQNVANFTEVLCHELGHSIGLDHSSEDPAETNPVFKQAIMYYLAHGNGRGAALNSFDIDASRQVHPPANLPPYCYDRVLDAVTTAVRPLNVPGVNTVQLRAYSLAPATLALATADPRNLNGTFTLTSNMLRYVPNGFYGDSARDDPAGNAYYDVIYARCAAGVNASPYVKIKVISFSADSYAEGIPDAWRAAYFGDPDPGRGVHHHASDDADGDGLSNLTEYWLGSDPANPGSNLCLSAVTPASLQWQAKAYEVYEVYRSTNLLTWTRAMNPVVPTNDVGTAALPPGGGAQFFRVLKVP